MRSSSAGAGSTTRSTPASSRTTSPRPANGAMAKASATAPSAHRLFHKRGDLGLFAGSQLAERVLNRPHGAVVDFRLVAEAERLVSDFELPCVLEVTDHIAVLGVGGHSVPRFRRESRSCGCDQCVDLLGNGAIRLLHSGDSRKQLRFPIRLGRLGLELPDTLARRRLFFGAESLGCRVGRAGAIRTFLCGFGRRLCWGHTLRSCSRVDENDLESIATVAGDAAIRRGVFRRVGALRAAIERFLEAWNEDAFPFAWIKTPEQ